MPSSSPTSASVSLSTSPPTPPSGIRGRPRSSSISHGSPGPALPLSLPGPGSSNVIASTSASSSAFWSHRPSLSVPGLIAPEPVGPGRVGRHRRTQSVSPPGFPVLSEHDPTGFEPNPFSTGPPKDANRSFPSTSPISVTVPVSVPRGTASQHKRRSSSPMSKSPVASSPSSSFSPSSSPSFSHSHVHHHHGSHAALLAGVRSHAHVHSPTLGAIRSSEDDVPNLSSTFSSLPRPTSSPQSPPFGPSTHILDSPARSFLESPESPPSPPPLPRAVSPPPEVPLFPPVPTHVSTVAKEDPPVPPPSPHRTPISLPPPVAAPAPLPPHLGGVQIGLPPKSRLKNGKGVMRHSPLSLNHEEADDEEVGEDDAQAEREEKKDESEETVGDAELENALRDAEATNIIDSPFGRTARPLSPDPAPSLSLPTDASLLPTPASSVPEPGRARSLSPPPMPGAFMDIDVNEASERGLGLQNVEHADAHKHTEPEIISMDEVSLSPLERIFICAKSENTDDRARVAYHLADWLTSVDILEAVEYVLPLLSGLALDGEDVVKEIFAPQLDRIMWHFFTQCSVAEFEAISYPPVAEDTTVDKVKAQLSSVEASDSLRYSPIQSLERPSPTSSHFPSDESTSSPTAATTSKTSPSHNDITEVPKIAVGAFTSLLGALLTDQSAIVANLTQAALVRFLCRLRGKPPPLEPEQPPPYGISPGVLERDGPSPNLLNPLSMMSEEAKQLIEDEFINGIILGLARLDEDSCDSESDNDEHVEANGIGASGDVKQHLASDDESDRHSTSNSLVMSPEEDLIEDSWLNSNADVPLPTGWGESLVSLFDGKERTEFMRLAPETSPMDKIYSSFSPDGGQDNEEAAIGKLVSMSLISAVASADCLDSQVLVEQLLPEVERMCGEGMFYVRKEAVQALAALCSGLPVEIVESMVVPLHERFASDQLWHVRRAACLALPSVIQRLPVTLQQKLAVNHLLKFGNDESRNVRSAALEVAGPIIYLFHGTESNVPNDLLAFFLGEQGSAVQPPQDDDIFAPLHTVLDSPTQQSIFFDTDWSPTTHSFQPTPAADPDRPAMTAFNFPAIILTLGPSGWPRVREVYLELCRHRQDKVRQSLASSLCEVARIIGPDQSDRDLLEPFAIFLRDHDQIQASVIETAQTTLKAFGPEAGRAAIEAISEAWPVFKAWRRRESIAKDLVALVEYFVLHGGTEQVLAVMTRAFKDPVAAVRNAAVKAVPIALVATSDDTEARSRVLAFLSVFANDASYRHRVTYTTAILAVVKSGFVDRAMFEAFFGDKLARLAHDRVVDVRMGVTRILVEACSSDMLYKSRSDRGPLQDVITSLMRSNTSDLEIVHLLSPFYVESSSSSSQLSVHHPSSPFHAAVDINVYKVNNERSAEGKEVRMDVRDDDEDGGFKEEEGGEEDGEERRRRKRADLPMANRRDDGSRHSLAGEGESDFPDKVHDVVGVDDDMVDVDLGDSSTSESVLTIEEDEDRMDVEVAEEEARRGGGTRDCELPGEDEFLEL